MLRFGTPGAERLSSRASPDIGLAILGNRALGWMGLAGPGPAGLSLHVLLAPPTPTSLEMEVKGSG